MIDTVAGRARAWSVALGRAVRENLLLVGILVAGVVLRGLALAAMTPVATSLADSIAYLSQAGVSLFGDLFRTAGYPLFLRIVEVVAPNLIAVVIVQSVLGLATSVLLYATVLRFTPSKVVAAIPAAAVALSGDQVFLEHAVMTEALYTFLVSVGVYAAARALTAEATSWISLALCGAAFGAAAWVRFIAIPVGIVCLLVVALGRRDGWRRRLATAGVIAGPLVVLLGGYAVAQGAATGVYGLSRAGGWVAYARTAPFADCSEFTPPDGTAFLCETRPRYAGTPAEARPGPTWYLAVDGPAIRRFGNPFSGFADRAPGDAALRAFARAAILAQPGDYVGEVAKDFFRHLDPSLGFDRDYSGAPAQELDFARRVPDLERTVVDSARRAGFGAGEFRLGLLAKWLEDYQNIVRVQGFSLLALWLLALAGLALGDRPVRLGVAMLWGAGAMTLLAPAATLSWGFRYGIPALGLFAAAAALGLGAIVGRATRGRRPGPAARASGPGPG